MARWAFVLALAVVGCGVSHEGDAGAPAADAGPCRPRTCAALSAECGVLDDGCGGGLECGTCDDGLACGARAPNQCGGCLRDADCAPGLACDVGNALCTDGCRTGNDISVALPANWVRVRVTLDGASLPEVEEPLDLELHVVPTGIPAGANPGVFVPLYDQRSPRPAQIVNLPVGVYDAHLVGTFDSARLASGLLPANDGLVVAGVEVGETTDALYIDIRTVRMTLVPLMNGGPLPPDLETTRLVLGRREWPLYNADGSPRATVTGRVLRGQYRAEIHSDYDSPEWSRYRWSVPLSIEDEAPVPVDFGRVSVTLSIAANGEPAEPGWHSLTLERVTGVVKDHLYLPSVLTTETLWLVPGRYEVSYHGDLGVSPVGSPISLDVRDDEALTLDVRRSWTEIRVDFGVDSTPPDCEAPAEIRIGDRSFEIARPDEPFITHAWVLHGSHGVRYEPPSTGHCVDQDTGWPPTSAALGTVLADGSPIVVRATRVPLTVTTTLAGEPLPVVSGVDPLLAVRPQLSLQSRALPRTSIVFPLYTRDEIAEPQRAREWVFEGDYSIVYNPGSHAFDLDWPLFAAPLSTVTVWGPTNLAVDVPRVRASVEMTLGAEPLPAFEIEAWRSGSPGLVTFDPADPPDEIDRIHDTWGASRRRLWPEPGASAPFVGWAVPGTYGLRFSWASAWWPTQLLASSLLPPIGQELGCWRVD